MAREHVERRTGWVLAAASTTAALLILWERKRRQSYENRAKWVEQAKDETLPGILQEFQDLKLDENCSIDEANKRRTTCYYILARDAHVYDLVVGVRSYPRLRNRRETELKRIFKYHTSRTKSHRTILCMCDESTNTILAEARNYILDYLAPSSEISTEGVWIPSCNVIPEADLHVTIATPFWWHTMRPDNRQLTDELIVRLKQAALFHHPFQLELERIVLLGGKTLVALWRCVGERMVNDHVIYDRHGEGVDPMLKLRHDIVACFTGNLLDIGNEPLTYTHRYHESQQSRKLAESTPPMPAPSSNNRENTIEIKTPGLGNHDGFVHTTLARLPLDCLSNSDVELAFVHRLCREATATYCGHRLVVSNLRFLETTGAGGESNPCVSPIADATIDLPKRIQVLHGGGINETSEFREAPLDSGATIGAPQRKQSRDTVQELFRLCSMDDENNVGN